MNVFLIGYRGTGKTTTGKILASLLHVSFVDTDQELEDQWKMTIEEMVTAFGWEEFRNREKQILARIAERKDQVIATGGGIVLAEENRKLIRSHGLGVLLEADAATIVRRISGDENSTTSRPRFDANASLLEETLSVLKERDAFYRECASLTFDTVRYSPEQVARQILDKL